MKIDIEINIEDSSWHHFSRITGDYFSTEDSLDPDLMPPIINLLRETTSMILAKHTDFESFDTASISLLLTNDQKITELNSQYRNKNKATNVLSFPENEFILPGKLEEEINNNYVYLGDIAMSYQTIASQATEKNISLADHFLHLYIHSILHLIGYDHAGDKEAYKMQSIEVEILSKFGIESPYE